MGGMDFTCDFCGKPLNGPVIEAYEIVHGGESAFHVPCRNIYQGYRHMKSQHDVWCHLEGCTKGPTDPFVFKTTSSF